MENKNKPAFPFRWDQTYHPTFVTEEGLTKREHFAAMAMQGLVSVPNTGITVDGLAKRAVQAADALLLELENKRS